MKKYVVILVVFLLFFGGCSTTPHKPESSKNDDQNIHTSDSDKEIDEINIFLSDRYMYPGTDLEVTIESKDEIECVYYYPIFSDTSVRRPYYIKDFERNLSITTTIPGKDKHVVHFTIPSETLYTQSYDLPIAIKFVGHKKTRGVVAKFDVFEIPEVSFEYDRYNWESEQTIYVEPKRDVIESVMYIDEDGIKQSLKKETTDGRTVFKLDTKLPPPDSLGVLEFKSVFGLTNSTQIKTYKSDEERMYFRAKKGTELDGKITNKYYIYSNNLDCTDLKMEFEIPVFEFEDEYFSSLVDDDEIVVHETKPSSSYLYSISPNNRYFVFNSSLNKEVTGDKIFEGRSIKEVFVVNSTIYDTHTSKYKYFNDGYFYTMNPRHEEGSLIWDDMNRLTPLYWKSDTELVMVKTIPENRFWSEYEEKNDPKITNGWTLSPPNPEMKVICLNVEDLSITEIDDHEAVRPTIQVADQVTGISSWYGPYDDFKTKYSDYLGWSNVHAYAISDKTGKHVWTAEDICEKLGIPKEDARNSSIVGYLGATIYQNRPRAIIRTSHLVSEQIYHLFDPITGDIEIVKREKLQYDDKNPEYFSGEVMALRSCSSNPNTPPLMIIENKLFKLDGNGSIEPYSDYPIIPDNMDISHAGYFGFFIR